MQRQVFKCNQRKKQFKDDSKKEEVVNRRRRRRRRSSTSVMEKVTLERQAKKPKKTQMFAALIWLLFLFLSFCRPASASLRKRVVDNTYSPELSSELPRLVEKLLVEEENEEEEDEEEENDERVVRGSVEEKVGWGMELG